VITIDDLNDLKRLFSKILEKFQIANKKLISDAEKETGDLKKEMDELIKRNKEVLERSYDLILNN
jgi:hypothetical protein